MYCQETMNIRTQNASVWLPSQSCDRNDRCRPGPRPKFGSSRALKATAIAAELSSRGMKYNAARTSRYRWCPAVNTPMRMLIGVWMIQVKIMILKVTQSACGRAGSVSIARQLVNPDGWIVEEMPFHVVKDRASTPSSGMMPKTVNMSSAGSDIQVTLAPLTAPPPPAVVEPLTTG